MGSRYKEDGEVKCPWYKKECSTEIKCEGLVSGHCTQTFRNARAKENHKYNFCLGNWGGCEHSHALEDKYEYENKRLTKGP